MNMTDDQIEMMRSRMNPDTLKMVRNMDMSNMPMNMNNNNSTMTSTQSNNNIIAR